MLGCGTITVVDPDDYREHVPDARIDLVLTGPGDFKGRLTWVNLRHVRLLRLEENVARIAFVALASEPVFVSFPKDHKPPPIWNGNELRPGEIILHARGERFHQRAGGASRWGLISTTPREMRDYGKALARVELVPPWAAKVLRPPSKASARLLRLFAQACRLAETKPDMIVHREVARALEQDLIHALVECLAAGEPRPDMVARARHAEIMARFEDVLAGQDGAPPPTPALAAAVGIPERTLRICCAEFLGMGPGEYARLRRLNLVRAALRRANPATATVADIAGRYGFSELGRFAAAYRMVFGEAPSATLQGPRAKIRRAAEFA